MTKTKISKLLHGAPLASNYGYLATPADYDPQIVTQDDLDHDTQIRACEIGDVAALLGDEAPEDATKRQAEKWIEGAVSTGAVVLDDPTHDDLVAYLTGE